MKTIDNINIGTYASQSSELCLGERTEAMMLFEKLKAVYAAQHFLVHTYTHQYDFEDQSEDYIPLRKKIWRRSGRSKDFILRWVERGKYVYVQIEKDSYMWVVYFVLAHILFAMLCFGLYFQSITACFVALPLPMVALGLYLGIYTNDCLQLIRSVHDTIKHIQNTQKPNDHEI